MDCLGKRASRLSVLWDNILEDINCPVSGSCLVTF